MSQMDMRLYNAAMEKLANLGGLQAAYVADAAGADASERASQLAGDRAREDEGSKQCRRRRLQRSLISKNGESRGSR